MSKKQTTTLSKTDFINTQTKGMSADEAVAAAKKVGLEITAGYVYTIRSAAKRKAAAGGTVKKAPAPKKGSAAVVDAVFEPLPAEDVFLALVSHIGVTRAQELIGQVAARIQHALGTAA